MDTQEAILTRKSTRAFSNAAVSKDNIDAIVKAGAASPVAMARYDTLHITVIMDPEAMRLINLATDELVFSLSGVKRNTDYGAPAMILVSAMEEDGGYEKYNVGIVIENMVISATALGIDSVIVGGAPVAIKQDVSLMERLNIPAGFTPSLGVLLGYAKEPTAPKQHTITTDFV